MTKLASSLVGYTVTLLLPNAQKDVVASSTVRAIGMGIVQSQFRLRTQVCPSLFISDNPKLIVK